MMKQLQTVVFVEQQVCKYHRRLAIHQLISFRCWDQQTCLHYEKKPAFFMEVKLASLIESNIISNW